MTKFPVQIIPPAQRLQLVDKSGVLTYTGLQFLQQLWTSIVDTNQNTPCTATNTSNQYNLTPFPTPPSFTLLPYADFQVYTFVAPATSTGTVTARVGSLGVVNVYTGGSSITQVGSGGVIANNLYNLVYDSSLNSGNGGFFLNLVGNPFQGFTDPANGFYVHNNGTNITYLTPSPNNYIRYSPSTAKFNQGGYWSSFQFTPPNTASLVYLDAQIWIVGGAANAPANWVAKWIKNFTVNGSGFQTGGTDVFAGIGALSQAGTGTAIMRASGLDQPAANDYYGLFVFVDGSGGVGTTITIDGNMAHSYITGAIIR